MGAPRPFCASCINEGPGLRPRQLDEGGPLFLLCARCDSEVPGRGWAPTPVAGAKWTGSRYFPLDEIQRDMPIMILKAIRRFDWLRSDELSDSLDIPSTIEDYKERNRFGVALSRMCREGYIESKVVRAKVIRNGYSRRHTGYHEWREYRITALGVAKLEWCLGATLAA